MSKAAAAHLQLQLLAQRRHLGGQRLGAGAARLGLLLPLERLRGGGGGEAAWFGQISSVLKGVFCHKLMRGSKGGGQGESAA